MQGLQDVSLVLSLEGVCWWNALYMVCHLPLTYKTQPALGCSWHT